MVADKEDIDTLIMCLGVASTETQIPSQRRYEAAQTVLRFLQYLRERAPAADPRT